MNLLYTLLLSWTIETMDAAESKTKIRELKELSRLYSYLFVLEMQKISREAAEGDGTAASLLLNMLEECRADSSWKRDNRWCSSVLHAIIQTRSPESLMGVIRFIRELPRGTPFGVIELISSLLPVYRRFILGPAREMSQNRENEILRAIGIQTLCNMYLEGYLGEDDAGFLATILNQFRNDRYFSQHYAELVRSAMASRKMQEEEFSFLVEIGSGPGNQDPILAFGEGEAARPPGEAEQIDSFLSGI